jgi:hypothetical protein
MMVKHDSTSLTMFRAEATILGTTQLEETRAVWELLTTLVGQIVSLVPIDVSTRASFLVRVITGSELITVS